jgi:hypothetical protein
MDDLAEDEDAGATGAPALGSLYPARSGFGGEVEEGLLPASTAISLLKEGGAGVVAAGDAGGAADEAPPARLMTPGLPLPPPPRMRGRDGDCMAGCP